MNEFRDAYGKNTTPEAEYQNGYIDGYVAGKEACADEIARLREALERIATTQGGGDCCSAYEWFVHTKQIARAALAEKEEK